MQFVEDRPDQKPLQNEFALIAFETYEDYLDSLYNNLDKCYLPSREVCRKIAEFGYRRDGITFSRKEFETKRNKILSYFTPVKPHTLASAGFRNGDPLQNALALRERANRVGLLTTIIFINYNVTKEREISGYIDYAHSLLKKDWKKFFKENKPIYPDKYDLGFYDWKKDITVINNSLYYKTRMTPQEGLVFQNKFDRMLIISDPFALSPGQHSIRSRIKTKMYNTCVLLDHTLRSRK